MLLRSVRRLGALGLLAVAAGCTPTYLLGVHPARPHATLTTADDYAEATTADSVRMALRFVAYEPEWLVFEAEYHNDSQQPITIDPTAFAHVPSRQAAAPSARRVGRGERVPAAVAAASQHAPFPSLPAVPLPALDPARQAEGLQQQANTEAAKASRPDWLGLALLVVSVGADMASVVRTRETQTQVQTRAALHDVAWTYNAISSANRARHAYTADALAWHAAQLRDFGLRQGTLLPGQQVRGYVFLPRFDAADSLRVLAPLGQGQAILDFAQVHQRR